MRIRSDLEGRKFNCEHVRSRTQGHYVEPSESLLHGQSKGLWEGGEKENANSCALYIVRTCGFGLWVHLVASIDTNRPCN